MIEYNIESILSKLISSFDGTDIDISPPDAVAILKMVLLNEISKDSE